MADAGDDVFFYETLFTVALVHPSKLLSAGRGDSANKGAATRERLITCTSA